MVAILSIHLQIPGCASLKEKRSGLKPLLARLHREFNISAAEMALQDKWQETIIACGMVGNNRVHLERSMQVVDKWVASNWLDLQVMDVKIELF